MCLGLCKRGWTADRGIKRSEYKKTTSGAKAHWQFKALLTLYFNYSSFKKNFPPKPELFELKSGASKDFQIICHWKSKKERKRLAGSPLELFIIHVTCETGLEVPPCSSANKLKNTLSAVLPAPLNIASGVSICLPCNDKYHSRWSGRKKPRDTSIW